MPVPKQSTLHLSKTFITSREQEHSKTPTLPTTPSLGSSVHCIVVIGVR